MGLSQQSELLWCETIATRDNLVGASKVGRNETRTSRCNLTEGANSLFAALLQHPPGCNEVESVRLSKCWERVQEYNEMKDRTLWVAKRGDMTDSEKDGDDEQ